MKNFLVVTNAAKDPDMKYTDAICNYIQESGGICKKEIRDSVGKLLVPEETECIIVLGGDGTVLRTAREILELDVPIIGVNLGTLGYLAEIEIKSINNALDMLLNDKYTIEHRMMISGRQNPGDSYYALNDVAITRKGSLQVVTIDIYVNGQFLTTFHADGVLVATPTGSTGYNMSAGGPIVEPQANLLLLTPICPHTMNTRTIVLAAEDEITVKIGSTPKGIEQELEACFDGSAHIPMRTGDSLKIGKSSKTTKIIKISQDSFLEVLHRKMKSD